MVGSTSSSSPLGVISSLFLENFTVFARFDEKFSPGINVIAGENSTGKSHLIKLCYAATKAIYPDSLPGVPECSVSEHDFPDLIADKLRSVFRCATLGALVRGGETKAVVTISYATGRTLSFSFTHSSKKVRINQSPGVVEGAQRSPICIPILDVFGMYPDLQPIYRAYPMSMDASAADLAETSVQRADPKQLASDPFAAEGVDKVLAQLAQTMGAINFKRGEIPQIGGRPITLAADGYRKLATIWHLLSNGLLHPGCSLFWDEPDAHLNPKLQQLLADAVTAVAGLGVQIVMASHSLFFMRQLHLSTARRDEIIDQRYLSLSPSESGVIAQAGGNLDEIPTLASLDAVLQQDEEMTKLFFEGMQK